MNGDQINQTKNKIGKLYSNLSTCNFINTNDIDKINKVVFDLEGILLDKNFNHEQEQEITTFMEHNNMLSVFQKAYEIFETNLEVLFARYMIQESLSPREDFKKYLLHNRFVTLLTNEVNLAHISKNDKVLFIGSGPIPITAIIMHQLTQSKIDCVEHNNISAELSKKVIGRLNYGNFIGIIKGEGVSIDYSSYSVILVALLAKPKDLILEAIWNKINIGIKIICRTSDLSKQAFYEKTSDALFNKYQPTKKVTAMGDQTISSVLLIKN